METGKIKEENEKIEMKEQKLGKIQEKFWKEGSDIPQSRLVLRSQRKSTGKRNFKEVVTNKS